MRRSQVQHKVFAGFGEFLPTYSSAFFAYDSYKIFPVMNLKVAIYSEDWLL